MIGALYLHIPFCIRRCRYCDFPTAAVMREDASIGGYVRALTVLVERCSAAGLLGSAYTAYVGGGTPTMAGRDLAALVGCVRQACPVLDEFTSEANPDSLTELLAAQCADAGLTRLSLGVQSFDDAELTALGRVHDARAAREAAQMATDAGLDLSCDLMCGIPLQTSASWARTLETALATGASHLSCYPLILEEGTPLERAVSRGEVQGPDDDAEADRMLEAARILQGSGFTRYEVASYARPGKACRHNLAYWKGVGYLGLGSAAASMLDTSSFAALCDALPLLCEAEDDQTLSGWPALFGLAERREGEDVADRFLGEGVERVARVRLRMIDPADAFTRAVVERHPLRVAVETLSAREAAAEDLMLAMRTAAGVAEGALTGARKAGIPAPSLRRTWEELSRRGLVQANAEGGYAPTERGWLLGNELYGALWDLAGDIDQSSERGTP